MERVTELHREAMNLAEEAAIAERRGEIDNAKRLLFMAFQKEKEGAELLKTNVTLEPTRSILFRSAASLAMECENVREAERLIGFALSGDPPEEIAEELRDLLEDVHFRRHLSLRGITLQPDEFQMSIAGKAVGYGMAPTEDVIARVTKTEKLLFRTAERKLGRTFREAGRPQKRISEALSLYMARPRAASFAITFRVGQSDKQIVLPSTTFAHEVVEEFLTCMEMLNKEQLQLLSERLDEDYYINFIKLAERIAPDGENINMVGFTSSEGKEIPLRVPRKKVRLALPMPPEVEHKEELITVKGLLLAADAKRKAEGLITVIDDKNAEHLIKVPRGLMSDIVKPLFEERVVVRGKWESGRIQLQDIDPEEEPSD
jgi:hypothetical protein